MDETRADEVHKPWSDLWVWFWHVIHEAIDRILAEATVHLLLALVLQPW